jgi:hypothetical protein
VDGSEKAAARRRGDRQSRVCSARKMFKFQRAQQAVQPNKSGLAELNLTDPPRLLKILSHMGGKFFINFTTPLFRLFRFFC